MNERKVCEILKLANSCPAMSLRESFFGIKEHLLSKLGKCIGPAHQRITQKCWGYQGQCCRGDRTCKCAGSGIYSDVIVVHAAYEWHGAKFLVPRHRFRLPMLNPPILLGEFIPYPIAKPHREGSLEATVALVTAFSGQTHHLYGCQAMTVNRMLVAMGQIPTVLHIPVDNEIPF